MSATSQPASKRKRNEDGEPSADPPIRSDIWFNDGNVVLQAGGTQFKVHQSILSINSTVFADMFLVPQPTSGGETVEGCPLVHLTDSAIDVAFVLEALFKRIHVTFNEPLPIDVVAAFVRLGQKYQLEVVLNEGLRRIHYEYPVELKAYDEMDKREGDWTAIMESDGIYIDVVNLARGQNLLSVLPLALHCCSVFYSSDEVVKGYKRKNQTIVTLLPINEKAVLAVSHPILLLGAKTTFSWLRSSGTDHCETNEDCNNFRNQLLIRLFDPVPYVTFLSSWEADWEEGLCEHCVKTAQAAHASGRQNYWDQLPSLFDLPSWDELKKKRL